ncbi:hypothetical protein OA238_c14680 [Octadecabacter arcticus 238]|uniref:Uncharacterized protein n=1 Tax=Octadecabacter arcticus 238 TaxID=391616 RepID=M9RIL1_9RHOB|nr:hypothetical protein OA238_c14680 [Octadecabacter arcticus 238]
MCQWDKHLSMVAAMFPDIVLDRGLPASKLMLVPQTFKNALGRVALLTVPAEIVLQPLINEAGKASKLGPLDLRSSLISGRNRKAHHLLHARARYPKMNGCCSFAHATSTCEADLSVKFHAENTPALPENRKD